MKTQQKGFTLIELIIVIVVLGILAVTAAPQFFNFSSDARKSAVKGLQGAVNGAKDIVYGKAAIEGIEAKESDDDGVGGVAIVYGYPAATKTALLAATNMSAADWVFVEGEGTEAATAKPAKGSIGIHPADVTVDFSKALENENSCHVLYTEATADVGAKVTAVTGGC